MSEQRDYLLRETQRRIDRAVLLLYQATSVDDNLKSLGLDEKLLAIVGEIEKIITDCREDNVVQVANEEDLKLAIANALRRANCTFDELAAQARTGRFDSMRARLAWVAIGDLYGAFE